MTGRLYIHHKIDFEIGSSEAVISTNASQVTVRVMHTDEESEIARSVSRLPGELKR